MRPVPATIALLAWLLLAGCFQQNVAPTAHDLRITEVRATSNTSFLLRFSSPLGNGADVAANYLIRDPDGVMLPVVAAHPSEGGSAVALATEPQADVAYSILVRNVTTASGAPSPGDLETAEPVRASQVAAPIVVEAVALSNDKVLIAFGEEGGGAPARLNDDALDPTAYTLLPDLDVERVEFSDDGGDRSRVVLTTASMQGDTYRVRVGFVTVGDGAALLDPFRSERSFRGIAARDETPPTLLGAFAPDAATVVLRFDEPLADHAADPSRYRIRDEDGGTVAVSAAVPGTYATRVTLATSTLDAAATYTVSADGLEDLAGNALAADASVTFAGVAIGSDGAAPRVTGATSTGPTRVLVTFSEPVRGGSESAENPSHYSIQGSATLNGAVAPQAILTVTAAELAGNGRSVVLTTLPQSEIAYTLRATNVVDLDGNTVVGTSREHPSEVEFFGTGSTGTPSDSDGDGLSDAAEGAGWTVVVTLADGRRQTSIVTSDPFSPDTDDDGVSDAIERRYGTHPRSADTDSDGLSDAQELNQVYSEPTDQDSDGDGLQDGLEFVSFRTSPILADTDGDQLLDGDEVVLGNRNPRVADLPLPGIEVEAIDLSLDTRFTATSVTGTRELESRTTNTTLTQSQSRAFSSTDSNTHEFFAKASAGGQYELGGDANVGKLTASFEVETGYTGQWSSSITRDSADASERAYEDSRTTDVETSREESVTREVQGASVRATVTLTSLGSIAFNIQNLQVTAFTRDPNDAERLVPVATLTPQAEPTGGFNLGPLIPKRGPLVFESTDVFPSLVEDLMRDPRGLVFKIANFDLTDELGRNFAFASQDISDRTAPLVLDFGGADEDGDGIGDDSARYRIATSAGRVLGDLNGDGTVDEEDRTVFDDRGRQVGIELVEALDEVLGLTPYDEDETPSASLDAVQLENSYSTRTTNGVASLWRIGTVSMDDGSLRRWEVITPSGIDRAVPFEDLLLRTGEGVTLAFSQDLDDDRVTARWEYLEGCSDDDVDSDDDGISDYEEIYTGWPVVVAGRGSRTVTSDCSRPDSDLDGLDDAEERDRGLDPERADSDGDGIDDVDEIDGFEVELRFGYEPDRDPPRPGVECSLVGQSQNGRDVVSCTTDPLDPDSDGDGLADGDERRLGVDPALDDEERALDEDGDGLVNFEETDGWTVSFRRVSTEPGVDGALVVCDPATYVAADDADCGSRPVSDPRNADTDGDGVPDGAEKALGLHPDRVDSDDDGLPDGEEVRSPAGVDGYELVYDPLDADIDDDGLSDGEEVNDTILVEIDGQAPYRVASDPRVADADDDGLPDSAEADAGTDPTEWDTDGDETPDGVEVARGEDFIFGNDTDPLAKDQLVEIEYEGRARRWTNTRICGGPLDAAGATFDADLFFTVNADETNHTASVYWGTGWATFATWTRIYEGGPINARGSVEGPGIYGVLGSFDEDVVPPGGEFLAITGIPQQTWVLAYTNSDECTFEVRFTVRPDMD